MNSYKCFIISILMISNINSLFFELSTSEERCFVDELIEDSVLFIKYKLYEVTENFDQTKNIQLKISKTDNETPLSLHSIKRVKGKHSFTSKESIITYLIKGGNYKICVFINGSSIFNRQSVKIRIRLDTDGSEEKDLSETLKNSDISFSTRNIRAIIRKGLKVIDHEKYNLDQEDRFTQTHVSYSKTFIYITVAQIFIVLGLGIYNLISFKNFLSQKNLI